MNTIRDHGGEGGYEGRGGRGGRVAKLRFENSLKQTTSRKGCLLLGTLLKRSCGRQLVERGAREEDGIRCKSENLALLRVHRPSGSEKAQKGAHWRLFPTVAEDEGYEGGENQEHLPPTQVEPPPTHRRPCHQPTPMGSIDAKKGHYLAHQM